MPNRLGGPWLAVASAVTTLIAVIAATAAVSYNYAIARDTALASATRPELTVPTALAPQFSAAEQAAAKERICAVFDKSSRGAKGKGGVVVEGELNVPVVLRNLNGAVAVQDALTPAAPPEIVSAADKFVETTMDLTTAALADAPIEELIQLTQIGNTAIYAFSDSCGLPR